MLKRSFTYIPPHPSIRSWVDGFYLESDGGEATSPRPYHVRPDDSSYLIVRRHGSGAAAGRLTTDRMPRLVGPRSTWKPIDLAGRAMTILVRFHPGAASALFRFHVTELLDDSCKLVSVARAPAKRLYDRLSDELSPKELVDELQHEILAQAEAAPPPDRLVASVLRRSRAAAGRISVGEMSRVAGLSSRQLRNRVRDATGLPPKLVARIHRLEHTLRLPGARPDMTPAALALAAGYADQSHLSREFRSLLGVSPAEWLNG